MGGARERSEVGGIYLRKGTAFRSVNGIGKGIPDQVGDDVV